MRRRARCVCRKCGKTIKLIKTKKGRYLPCDPGPRPYREDIGGRDRIVTPSGDVKAGTFLHPVQDGDGYGYMPHFATCWAPEGNKHGNEK